MRRTIARTKGKMMSKELLLWVSYDVDGEAYVSADEPSDESCAGYWLRDYEDERGWMRAPQFDEEPGTMGRYQIDCRKLQ